MFFLQLDVGVQGSGAECLEASVTGGAPWLREFG